MRSPLVDTSEHCIRKRVETEEMNNWYQYLWSGYVNSIWDKTVVTLSDSDFDGDKPYNHNGLRTLSPIYSNIDIKNVVNQ